MRRLIAALVISVPFTVVAQEPVSNLGLAAVGTIGIHGGMARLERKSRGQEGGLLLDLGWLRGRSLRLRGEVSFLRAALTEYVELEDSTFSGDFYDLTGSVTAMWLGNRNGQVSPYVLGGMSVHALSSAFQTSELDQRYNANRFGSHVGAGMRLRFGSSRQAVYGEIRRVIADQVDRTVVRVGVLALLGDLYR